MSSCIDWLLSRITKMKLWSNIGFSTRKFLHYSNYLKIAHGSQMPIVWPRINSVIVFKIE